MGERRTPMRLRALFIAASCCSCCTMADLTSSEDLAGAEEEPNSDMVECNCVEEVVGKVGVGAEVERKGEGELPLWLVPFVRHTLMWTP